MSVGDELRSVSAPVTVTVTVTVQDDLLKGRQRGSWIKGCILYLCRLPVLRMSMEQLGGGEKGRVGGVSKRVWNGGDVYIVRYARGDAMNEDIQGNEERS